MERWQRRKRIWIRWIFMHFEIRKQTCIQWFLESTILILLEPNQWIGFEILWSFQRHDLRLYCRSFTRILKIIPSKVNFMIIKSQNIMETDSRSILFTIKLNVSTHLKLYKRKSYWMATTQSQTQCQKEASIDFNWKIKVFENLTPIEEAYNFN